LDGWIDLQVNGIEGVNFSSPDLSFEDIHRACENLFSRGTEGFLATIITSSWETYLHVLPLIAKASRELSSDPKSSKILGIHLEGPFISPSDGARGVHLQEYTRFPSTSIFGKLLELSDHQIKLITLAPELPGAISLIQYVTNKNVIVSLGHTLAETNCVQAAVDAGARLSTHIGNGLPLMIHRHQNPIWPQLANPQLIPMVIADGHHLPAEFIKVVMAVKGIDNVIIVSDSSPAAGLPSGSYDFFGIHSVLEPGGRLYSPETGLLAGSSATMRDCMNWLAGIGISHEERLRLGRENPLNILKYL
jgi:N-acetylglucosamine-6-phosphate deacetylase